MAISVGYVSILCLALLCFRGSLADSPVCPRSGVDPFVAGVRLQCPPWIERLSPEQVNGDELDSALGHAPGKSFHSIFFYASWCPFSRKTQPIFDALSTMFPQINHLAVEESSAMPSVFSRYGVHSFPVIMIANGTTRIQYHGSKDLNSLMKFYKRTTGYNPVAYLSIEESPNSRSRLPLSPHDQSLSKLIRSEPYLSLSVAFICLKAILCFFPVFLSRIRAFLAMHTLHLNLGIFGEWNHLLERALHVIDLKKLQNKLRLCNKTRSFKRSAKNARVWASSLASVSLGESSSRES